MTDTEILAALTDQQALACTMYGEARGDGRDGSSVEERIAVACAIRNRVREPRKYGDSFKGVCLKKYQFSCWNDTDPNRPQLLGLAYRMVTGQALMDALADETLYLADGVRTGIVLDRVAGANHYMVDALFQSARAPAWAFVDKAQTRRRAPDARCGSHVFFVL